MRGIVGLLWIVIVGGAVLVGAGEFAGQSPVLDVPNHFRPQIAIIVGTFAVAAMPVRRWFLAALGAATAAWATLAVMDDGACALPAGNGPTVSVLTFNLWGGNYDVAAIEQRVRDVDADIVVMEEFGIVQTPLRESLADLYPERIDCADSRGCRLALYAKTPWEAATLSGRDQGTPPVAWAHFAATEERPAYTIVGAHISNPVDNATRQMNDLAILTGILADTPQPLIVAGDFNATPWSHALHAFRADTGLCGAPGYRPSWPAWLDAIGLPIDQVFVSEGLGVTAQVLQAAGSDHLPISAVVTLR